MKDRPVMRGEEQGGGAASGMMASSLHSVGSASSYGSMVEDVTSHPDFYKPVEAPILVYHESARSIVFRDQLRRQASAISDLSIHTTTSHTTGANHHHRDSSSRASSKHGSSRSIMSSHHGNHQPHNHDPGERLGTTDELKSVHALLNPMAGVTMTSPIIATEPDMDESSDTTAGQAVHVGSASHASSTYNHNNNISNHAVSALARTSPSPPPSVVVANFMPIVDPLAPLELGSNDTFDPILQSDPALPATATTEPIHMTDAERHVVRLLRKERAVVKTIRNADWTAFLTKFVSPAPPDSPHSPGRAPRRGLHHADHSANPSQGLPFNSFVTSTTLLPSYGKKMRCFGSTKEFTTGVVFSLIEQFPPGKTEEEEARRTNTWSWPSGYSAKTEFNIDDRGNLINGRQEALVSLEQLRQMNHTYLHETDYEVGGRMVKGGLNTIPYNEAYVRVGGVGRIVEGVDCATGKKVSDNDANAIHPGRSFDSGVGLPIALFVRTPSYGHLVSLIRTRARTFSVFGSQHMQGIPLLLITDGLGVRVLTEELQRQLLHIVSSNLNPFQNATLQFKTEMNRTSPTHLQQKFEELIDLDSHGIRQILTPEECARLAGGFGATDDSVAHLLEDAMEKDEHGKIQDIVNEGLSSAVRAGDYHTSRQLLILYTLVASKGQAKEKEQPKITGSLPNEKINSETDKTSIGSNGVGMLPKDMKTPMNSPVNSSYMDNNMVAYKENRGELGRMALPPPPPPPPLDTDRLRSATNSDGLLAVLGAAQVLKAMQDGGAKRRVEEAVNAVEEWIKNGEQSVAFRLASWRDQRAAQGDLKIAMENDSNFMTFVSNTAVSNRKKFAQQLRESIVATDFESVGFLKSIFGIVSKMRSPCLRLELLQYILGLDNRYSVAHVARSVELAATCMNISMYENAQTDPPVTGGHTAHKKQLRS